MPRYFRSLVCATLLASTTPVIAEDEAQVIPVYQGTAAPLVDGSLSEWTGAWQSVALHKAVENDKKVRVGSLDIEVQAQSHEGYIYFALRWADKRADIAYRPWEWKGKKYKRNSKKRDDMLALRFERGAGFNACMIADADYEVDVWVWSAGRSNMVGRAMNSKHVITTRMLEDAAEHEHSSGKTIYIKKFRKDGNIGFANVKVKRKVNIGASVPSTKVSAEPSGNVANVEAKGQWQDGFWHLELRRELAPAEADDVVFSLGQSIKGQLAVFENSYAEHKLVSKILEFQLD